MMRRTIAALGTVGIAGASSWAAWRAWQGRHAHDAHEATPEAAESTAQTQLSAVPHPARVVILGAGFAGLAAARAIEERAGASARVTLVDRHNYHLFTPLLYQVATCGVDPYDVAYPVRQFAGRHHLSFRRGTVGAVDFPARRVHLDSGAGDTHLDYDHLVIALGSTTNFFGNDAAREHALALKWLEDGVAVRHRVLDALERASTTTDDGDRHALLTFVVIGGGATGVETAAALADLLRETLPVDYPRLGQSKTRIVLVEGSDGLLGHMDPRMARAAAGTLRAKGVEVWLNAKASDVSADKVVVEDGRAIAAHTVVWATGVRAPDVVAKLDVTHGKAGSLAVNEYLQLPDHPEVFAVGDNAHFVDQRTHQPAPLLAAAAVQMGRAAGENVARAIAGRDLHPFHYHDLGTAVSLGRNAGTAQFGGLVVNGLAGWFVWRAIHLAKITSFRNRLGTALDWSVGYVYDKDTARLDLRAAA